MTDRERFVEKIASKPKDGCWLWGGGLHVDGYGTFHADGRTRGAHRVSYELFKGPIPEGLHVLHLCDVPGCVNPDHLFTGTNRDNVRDMIAKGRVRGGVRHPRAKATEDDVRAIRSDRRVGSTWSELSERYGLSIRAIRNLVNRITWRHVA